MLPPTQWLQPPEDFKNYHQIIIKKSRRAPSLSRLLRIALNPTETVHSLRCAGRIAAAPGNWLVVRCLLIPRKSSLKPCTMLWTTRHHQLSSWVLSLTKHYRYLLSSPLWCPLRKFFHAPSNASSSTPDTKSRESSGEKLHLKPPQKKNFWAKMGKKNNGQATAKNSPTL